MKRPSKPRSASPYRGPERRHHPRHTLQVPMELHVEGSKNMLCVETSDLSRNGCYVRFENPLPVGLYMRGILWLDELPVQVAGRVVTRHPEYGNGIMFLHLQEASEKALANYVEAVIAESVV